MWEFVYLYSKLTQITNKKTENMLFIITMIPIGDRNQSQYYEGRMMEARLWYSALDGGLIGTTYGSRRLTGYEKDLVHHCRCREVITPNGIMYNSK